MLSQKIKLLLTGIFSLLLCQSGFSQDLKTQISVDFKIKNFGINVDGFFGDVSISNNFSSQDVSEWTLEGIIKVNSIKTGIEKRDQHLLEDDYFDVEAYPEIKLVATNFKKASEETYDVTVDLTIKKTTKRITIPIEIIRSNESMKLKTYFEINRRDYEVGGSSFSMSNTAKITVNYTLIKN